MLVHDFRCKLFRAISIGLKAFKNDVRSDAAPEIHHDLCLGCMLTNAAQQCFVQPQPNRVVGIFVKSGPRVIMRDMIFGLCLRAVRKFDRLCLSERCQAQVIWFTDLWDAGNHNIGLGDFATCVVRIDKADAAVDGLKMFGVLRR